MPFSFKFPLRAAALAVVFGSGAIAQATDYTWTGTADGNWTNTGNWTPTGTPNATADTATLTGSTHPTIALSGTQTVNALTFGSGMTTSFSLTGGTLALADGGTVTKQAASATTSATIGSTLAIGTSATLANTDTGPFTAGRNLIVNTITGSGTLHVAGGTAAVTFSGNNAGFSGPVSIDSGYFLPTTNTAMGTGTITMNTGSAVWLASTSNLANNWVIAGNATWGSFNGNSQSGTVTVDNGATWTIDNGGGNFLGLSNVISGQGAINFTAANTTFSGSSSNTLSGTITQGANAGNDTFNTLTLAKINGAVAIAGNLKVANKGIVSWGGNNQIATTSNIELAGGSLKLNGYSNTVGTLTLSGSSSIDVSGGASALHFADSSATNWTGKQVLISNYTGGQTVSVGGSTTALSSTQLSRVGFVNPSGLSAGLYHATLSSSGVLAPTGSAVQATNPLWDMSPSAVAARTAVYNKPGIAELSGSGTPLKAGTKISFFGDSITWLNGYLTNIQSGLASGSGSSGLGVQLYNHGINGGGARDLLNGSTKNAYNGGDNNGAQAAFNSVIKTDKSDVAVIFIGVNDVVYLGTTPTQFSDALTQMINQGKANGTKMVLCTDELDGELPDGQNQYDTQMNQYAQLARDVASSTGTTLVDLRAAAKAYEQNNNYSLNLDGSLNYASNGILTYDGIHPTSTGNNFLANLIADGIYQSVATPEPASLSLLAAGGMAMLRRRSSRR